MRFLSMAALALVGAVMTGCSSDDSIIGQTQPQTENTNNVVTMTTTVSIGGGAATRALTADGTKTFAADEQIAVVYENTSSTMVKESVTLTAGDISADGKTATFTVSMTAPKASGSLKYIYPAAMAKADGSVNYDALNSQDGTLNTLSSSLDLALYEGSLTSEGTLPTGSISMTNPLAILAYTLKNSDGSSDITSGITGMTVSDGTNTYSVTRSAAAGPIYVAIRPTTSAAIEITATDGTNNYTKSLTGKTYAAGNGYSISLRMAAASTPLDNTTTAWTAGTFAVPADGLTYSDAITVSGDVTLVLTDGETLTLNKGISIADGATLTIEGNGTMNVNGTSNSPASTVAGTGTLVLTSGTLNVKGGNGGSVGGDHQMDVTANAGGVAINAAVTVNGGTLTATGGNGGSVTGDHLINCKGGAGGAAISGDLTVTGGTMTTTNGNNGSVADMNADCTAGAGGKAVAGTVTDNR